MSTKLNPTMRSFFAASGSFRNGEDTPSAFLKRCIESIEAHEPAIGAFVATDFGAARAAADAATERWRAGQTLSPIDGLPIGIKLSRSNPEQVWVWSWSSTTVRASNWPNAQTTANARQRM